MKRFDLAPYRPIATDDLIRVGKQNDGGYVIPRTVVDQSTALLSLGVNLDWSFEQSFLRARPGLKIVCVDGTTGLGKAVKKAFQKSFDMVGHLVSLQTAKGLRDAEFVMAPFGFYRFFSRHTLLKLMVGDDSREGYVSVNTLLRDNFSITGDVFLKMDIEGFEYEALPLEKELYPQISGMVIEFHDLEQNWDKFQNLMTQLMQEFHVAHIHGNNNRGYIPDTRTPDVLEISLINRKFRPSASPLKVATYPLSGLDMPCNPKYPDLGISFD